MLKRGPPFKGDSGFLSLQTNTIRLSCKALQFEIIKVAIQILWLFPIKSASRGICMLKLYLPSRETVDSIPYRPLLLA